MSHALTTLGSQMAKQSPPPPTDNERAQRRDLWPLEEAMHLLGFSRSTMDRHRRAGSIRAVRVGSRVYVSDAELRRFVATLEAAEA
jgi:excisionase family DNA binding protein